MGAGKRLHKVKEYVVLYSFLQENEIVVSVVQPIINK